MFCPNCGNQAKDGQSFCSKCGTKLNAPAAPQFQQFPQQPPMQQPFMQPQGQFPQQPPVQQPFMQPQGQFPQQLPVQQPFMQPQGQFPQPEEIPQEQPAFAESDSAAQPEEIPQEQPVFGEPERAAQPENAPQEQPDPFLTAQGSTPPQEPVPQQPFFPQQGGFPNPQQGMMPMQPPAFANPQAGGYAPGQPAANPFAAPAGTVGAKKFQPNFFGIVAALIAAVSVFLPFWQHSVGGGDTLSLMQDGIPGVIVLVIAAIGLGLSCIGINLGVITAGAAEIGFCVFKNLNIESEIKKQYGDVAGEKIIKCLNNGWGFYLLLIGGGLLVLGGVIGMVLKINKKGVKK